ncbi:GTPase [Maribacter chungangensis]|uniref:GTPase n=1 Tax=Maribacter chungangensis TaxID=1069117 RepID=A0ABW3B8B4_9FLAO
MSQKLVFIYNADSGLRNAIVDGAHKILSPATYRCSLCNLTHGVLSEKKVWQRFRSDLEGKGAKLEFLHKNEFGKVYRSKFGHKFTYPIVLIEGNNGFEILVHTQELEALETAKQLIKVVEERL